MGYGVFMLNYRRYGGSGGRPSEAKNISDAALAYDWLWKRGLKPSEIVAYGESIGSGVATQLARLRPVKALVMEATFTSIVDVGRQVWWCLPLNLIMVDQYRNLEHIKNVKVPVLIMHGARDRMIPVTQARHLYAEANEPKKLAILPRGDHSDLYDCGAVERMRDFLDALDTKVVVPVPVRHAPAARGRGGGVEDAASTAAQARRLNRLQEHSGKSSGGRRDQRTSGGTRGWGLAAIRPSRCAFLRASFRALRMASAFSRARFSEGFS